MSKYIIHNFIDDNGKNLVEDWLNTLDGTFRRRIKTRLKRIEESGNFGDHKQLNSDLYELRYDFGAGYRIYYTIYDNIIVLLISGGDKKTQSKDIEKAMGLIAKMKGGQNGL